MSCTTACSAAHAAATVNSLACWKNRRYCCIYTCQLHLGSLQDVADTFVQIYTRIADFNRNVAAPDAHQYLVMLTNCAIACVMRGQTAG